MKTNFLLEPRCSDGSWTNWTVSNFYQTNILKTEFITNKLTMLQVGDRITNSMTGEVWRIPPDQSSENFLVVCTLSILIAFIVWRILTPSK